MSEERERYPEEGAADRREEEGAPLAAAQTRRRDRRSRYRSRVCSAACRSGCAARSVRRSCRGGPPSPLVTSPPASWMKRTPGATSYSGDGRPRLPKNASARPAATGVHRVE